MYILKIRSFKVIFNPSHYQKDSFHIDADSLFKDLSNTNEALKLSKKTVQKDPKQNFDREDLETLWKLVKAKHGSTRPEEGYERVL
ncbi:hypothetical protein Tco_1352411 [Tanacetum coccineum]